MTPPSCLIKFEDTDGTAAAYLRRNRHGHPEDVISNITAFQTVIAQQPVQPTAGTLTAQFLVIDALQYVYQQASLAELGDLIHRLVRDPRRANAAIYRALGDHSMLDGDAVIDDVGFVYRVEVSGTTPVDWQLSVARVDVDRTTARESFERAEWMYTAPLSELME